MINFKALATGIFLIISLILLFQLIFILAATGYTVIIKQYPEWQTIGQLLAYGTGAICYFFIMSTSGYITAYIAEKNIYLHTFLIAILTTGISLVISLREDNLTLNSILFVVAGILFSMIGGYTWIRHQEDEAPHLNG